MIDSLIKLPDNIVVLRQSFPYIVNVDQVSNFNKLETRDWLDDHQLIFGFDYVSFTAHALASSRPGHIGEVWFRDKKQAMHFKLACI